MRALPDEQPALLPAEARLVEPAKAWAASFVDALVEGFRRGNRPPATVREVRLAQRDFDRFLQARRDQTAMMVLPNGNRVRPVPFSLHWLVAGRVFVGELSFRHELNAHLRLSGGHIGYGIRPSLWGQGFGKRLLALGLDQAAAHGLERALLTCHDGNARSAAVIEANGGVLEDVIDDVFGGGPLRRYWIDLEGRTCRA